MVADVSAATDQLELYTLAQDIQYFYGLPRTVITSFTTGTVEDDNNWLYIQTHHTAVRFNDILHVGVYEVITHPVGASVGVSFNGVSFNRVVPADPDPDPEPDGDLTISAVTGTISNGESVTVSGAGFLTNPAVGTTALESIGANIEAGTANSAFSKTSWGIDTDWATVVYSTDQAHSGTKSLKAPVQPGGEYNGIFKYEFPSGVTSAGDELYFTYWIRQSRDFVGQWKMFRLERDETIVDNNYEFVCFNWNDDTGKYCGNDTAVYFTSFPDTNSVWQRVEVFAHTSTTDGTFEFNLYTPGSAKVLDTKTTDTHLSAHNWNWLIFQNYYGNYESGSTAVQPIYFDDVFVQHGSQARVEVCDTSTWTARTHCEIQIPTEWATGSISLTVQRGSFGASDTAYMYVVDSTGAVNSNGYEITFE